jgi:hypothetical protein
LIGLAFVVVEVLRVAGQITARYPDFYVWAERASRLNLDSLSQWEWVNGLYPLGYPVLLRLGVLLGLNVLQVALAYSILGGFLGLLGTFWLVRRMTNNWTLAVLSEVILACTSHYLLYSSRDITDSLPAALQICSFALLMGNLQRRRAAFGAGLLVGLSYLLRYTASTTILLCVVFLLGWALVRRQRYILVATGLYLLGALLGGLPQLAASAIVKGNPIYNVQAHNLWFHLQNSTDYIYDWQAVPLEISLREVISADPALFLSHWWGVLRTSWLTLDPVAVDGPLLVLAPAGFLYAILARRPLRPRARAFLAFLQHRASCFAFTRPAGQAVLDHVDASASDGMPRLSVERPPSHGSRTSGRRAGAGCGAYDLGHSQLDDANSVHDQQFGRSIEGRGKQRAPRCGNGVRKRSV